MKSLFAALLVISTFPAAAQAQQAAKPDPAKGEAIFTNGDASRNIIACVSCHGPGGNSTIVQNPKLAQQHPFYTRKQLQDFKGETRKNPVMTPIAQGLTAEEAQNIAAYLALQESKPGAAKNRETIDLGKQIYRGGIAEKKVPACASCHGATGGGIPNPFARIAGQHQEYTTAQLVNFRSGTRSNAEQMTTIAKRLSDDEIQAVADYIAGLK